MVPAINFEPSSIPIRFIDAIRCTSCKNNLRRPMKSSCGHRFCQDCLFSPGQRGDSKLKIVSCPSCSSGLKKKNLIKDDCFLVIQNDLLCLIDEIKPLIDKYKNEVSNEISKDSLKKSIQNEEPIKEMPSTSSPKKELQNLKRKATLNEESQPKMKKKPVVKIAVAKPKNKKQNETKERISKPKPSKVNPKTSTPATNSSPNTLFDRELSPFPASIIMKCTGSPVVQLDKLTPSPNKIKPNLAPKLCFDLSNDKEKEKLNQKDTSLNNDNFHSPIRNENVTYSRFDRIKLLNRKSVFVQTHNDIDNNKNKNHEESDLYCTLSNLFNCLCTQRGVQGSISIEGIGKFEVKLSKSSTVADTSTSKVCVHVNQEVQTDSKQFSTKSTLTEELQKDVNSQTDLDYFVNVEKDVFFPIHIRETYNELKKKLEIMKDKWDLGIASRYEEPENQGYVPVLESVPEVTDELDMTDENKEKEKSSNMSQEYTKTKNSTFNKSDLETTKNTDVTNRMNVDNSSTDNSERSFVNSLEEYTSKAEAELVSRVESSHLDSEINSPTVDEELESNALLTDESKSNINDVDKTNGNQEKADDIVAESDDDDKFMMSCIFESINDEDSEEEEDCSNESINSKKKDKSPQKKGNDGKKDKKKSESKIIKGSKFGLRI